MPARARQEADENEEDAAVVDGVVIGAQTRVAWPRETVVRAADGAADVDVAVADGVVDEAEGGVVGADSASLPEGTVVRAADGAADES